MDFNSLIEALGQIVDAVGVAIIFFGIIISTSLYFVNILDKEKNSYKFYKTNLGKIILLGLEFLIAGDIIRSAVVTPTIMGVIILAIIVLIRTILSIQLDMEVSGKWPWQKKTKI